ncbi:MAG: prolipoprotein diacylglyceryl transferase [Chloroflexi bacterium]|nr:prolipoprotein diacylglyceryl transferase [Chloroflexota bacterium]
MIALTPDPVAIQLGPLSVPWYGLGYAAAIVAAVWLGGREAELRGIPRRHISDGLVFVVLLGVIGARLYHVIDQWALYQSDPLRIILPPYSGLGLYGGIAGGLLGVYIYTRRHSLPYLRLTDALVPSVLLGQAIARWGNFFNQELYGPPTDLPWGIAIECQFRVPAYPCDGFPVGTTGFHPLFFYESMLNLAGALVALWIGRRLLGTVRDGDLTAFWFIWYGATRTALEPFREGYNWTFFGRPVATLIGIAAIVGGLIFIAMRHRQERGGPGTQPLDPPDDPAPAPVPARPRVGPGTGVAVAEESEPGSGAPA